MKLTCMGDDQGEKESQGEEEGESRGGLQSVSPTQLTWNVEFELNNEIENPLIKFRLTDGPVNLGLRLVHWISSG
jgi:hypothetical protein